MARPDDFSPEKPKKKPRPPDEDAEQLPQARRRRPAEEDEEPAPRPKRRRVEADEDEPAPKARRRRVEEDEEEERPRRARRRRDEDEEEGGGAVASIIPYKNPKALAAYYCGVFSVIPILGLLLGPIAVLFGVLGMLYVGRHPIAKGTGHAITGIILGFLVTILNWGVAIYALVIVGWKDFALKYF